MSTFTVEGVEYTLVQSPTFGEARAIEKVTGKSFAAISTNPELQTMDFTQALVWVSMKRVEPTLTFSDLDDLDIEILASIQSEDASEGDAAEIPTVGDVDSNEEQTSPVSA